MFDQGPLGREGTPLMVSGAFAGTQDRKVIRILRISVRAPAMLPGCIAVNHVYLIVHTSDLAAESSWFTKCLLVLLFIQPSLSC